MEILKQYNEDTLELISAGSYELKPFDEMYVDSYFDLINAWGNQTDSKVDWGNAHWNNHGKGEGRGYPVIKLSVFSDVGSFLENEDLSKDIDYYIKDTQLFLKPNEYLDRKRRELPPDNERHEGIKFSNSPLHDIKYK